MARKLSLWLLVFVVALLAAVLFGCSSSSADAPPPVATPAPSSVLGSDSAGLPDVAPPQKPAKAPSDVPDELKLVWEAWSVLRRDHVDRDKMDPDKFSEAAIRGMLTALDDPHTNYVRPEAFEIENSDIMGKFEGIGANVSLRQDGKLIVVAPIEGSPAQAAGIRPGDIILEVDGETIEGLSLIEAVNRIRGPRGSQVRLLVVHLGAVDPVELVVTRDVIPLTSVLLRSNPGDRIAHIRLTGFYPNTAEELSQMVQEAVAGGAKGLIIDVRDNPGGLLESVVEVTSLFLDDGLVLYEIDGNGKRTDLKVTNGGVATDIPLVLLANEFSASASEILVGALQDYGRATFVGATTFGKGSVNILRRLSNKGGLYVTTARWYTPSGRVIDRTGLTPDVEVTSRDPQKADTLQLEKALEVLESHLGAASNSASPGP